MQEKFCFQFFSEEECMCRKLLMIALVLCFVAGTTQATIILSVDRSRGQPTTGTANKAPIGVFDSETNPMPVNHLSQWNVKIVFSDRTYPWINTPVVMLGYEYVPTFNDDKAASEIMVQYAVTIGEAAKLWMTVDNRIPAEWLEVKDQAEAVWLATHTWAAPGTFVDTGLDLFIQESSTTNRAMSVWMTKEEMPAGTYAFGLMPSGKNFYTIGTIPEPATIALLGLGALTLLRRKK
jgi:hypothetical protein